VENGKGGGGVCHSYDGRWGGYTASVHLNSPRNMRVSVVVMRSVLFRREVR
jgi:hypothetical protein